MMVPDGLRNKADHHALSQLSFCYLVSFDSRTDMTDREGECYYYGEKYVQLLGEAGQECIHTNCSQFEGQRVHLRQMSQNQSVKSLAGVPAAARFRLG